MAHRLITLILAAVFLMPFAATAGEFDEESVPEECERFTPYGGIWSDLHQQTLDCARSDIAICKYQIAQMWRGKGTLPPPAKTFPTGCAYVGWTRMAAKAGYMQSIWEHSQVLCAEFSRTQRKLNPDRRLAKAIDLMAWSLVAWEFDEAKLRTSLDVACAPISLLVRKGDLDLEQIMEAAVARSEILDAQIPDRIYDAESAMRDLTQ